jgi:hypothetical protein
MEGYFSTGQSPQWAVVPVEEEEEEIVWCFFRCLVCKIYYEPPQSYSLRKGTSILAKLTAVSTVLL